MKTDHPTQLHSLQFILTNPNRVQTITDASFSDSGRYLAVLTGTVVDVYDFARLYPILLVTEPRADQKQKPPSSIASPSIRFNLDENYTCVTWAHNDKILILWCKNKCFVTAVNIENPSDRIHCTSFGGALTSLVVHTSRVTSQQEIVQQLPIEPHPAPQSSLLDSFFSSILTPTSLPQPQLQSSFLIPQNIEPVTQKQLTSSKTRKNQTMILGFDVDSKVHHWILPSRSQFSSSPHTPGKITSTSVQTVNIQNKIACVTKITIEGTLFLLYGTNQGTIILAKHTLPTIPVACVVFRDPAVSGAPLLSTPIVQILPSSLNPTEIVVVTHTRFIVVDLLLTLSGSVNSTKPEPPKQTTPPQSTFFGVRRPFQEPQKPQDPVDEDELLWITSLLAFPKKGKATIHIARITGWWVNHQHSSPFSEHRTTAQQPRISSLSFQTSSSASSLVSLTSPFVSPATWIPMCSLTRQLLACPLPEGIGLFDLSIPPSTFTHKDNFTIKDFAFPIQPEDDNQKPTVHDLFRTVRRQSVSPSRHVSSLLPALHNSLLSIHSSLFVLTQQHHLQRLTDRTTRIGLGQAGTLFSTVPTQDIPSSLDTLSPTPLTQQTAFFLIGDTTVRKKVKLSSVEPNAQRIAPTDTHTKMVAPFQITTTHLNCIPELDYLNQQIVKWSQAIAILPRKTKKQTRMGIVIVDDSSESDEFDMLSDDNLDEFEENLAQSQRLMKGTTTQLLNSFLKETVSQPPLYLSNSLVFFLPCLHRGLSSPQSQSQLHIRCDELCSLYDHLSSYSSTMYQTKCTVCPVPSTRTQQQFAFHDPLPASSVSVITSHPAYPGMLIVCGENINHTPCLFVLSV
ncbi:hypothetical protein BLNAU_1810 [Blattamonas nauphoetae]|uniref:Uncharacterized protein n=1 Tax=Blattamonas nauphoetae TaxID=2049346 RepID=A0ABQ9YHN7_9EUKA|nr:hypothetical protein BLNAU_1810 [Blattamonas nauphoetae]